MVGKVLAILVAASVLGTTLVDTEAALERAEDHHEHGSLLDAPSDGSHQHGDEDDHHESPDSPCDHHVMHCCCGHVHVIAAAVFGLTVRAETSQVLKAPSVAPEIDPSIERILHIPIA